MCTFLRARTSRVRGLNTKSSAVPVFSFSLQVGFDGTVIKSFSDFDVNSGKARAAVIDVGGNRLTVQQATGCSLTLTPGAASVSPEGGAGTFRIIANDPACTWKATTKATWIRFESGTGGRGDGMIRYVASKNTTGAGRDAQILVNGVRFNVHQSKGTTQEPGGKSKRRSSRH